MAWKKRQGLWLCAACLAEILAMEYGAAADAVRHLTEPQFPDPNSPRQEDRP